MQITVNGETNELKESKVNLLKLLELRMALSFFAAPAFASFFYLLLA